MAKKETNEGPLTREDVQKMIDASILAHDIVHGHHEPVPADEPPAAPSGDRGGDHDTR